MRESRTYGSVRGALSNGRPYRDKRVRGERARSRVSLRVPGLRLLKRLDEAADKSAISEWRPRPLPQAGEGTRGQRSWLETISFMESIV